jgi:O-acetyl-ADP-ribose deacetylase (regulator of RNase III)
VIRIVQMGLDNLKVDAILRSVSAEMDADTPFSRDVERRAGSEVSDRLLAMGDLPVGAAVITPSGGLTSPFLIHVVLQSQDEPVTLDGVRTALLNGLRRAGEWGLGTIAVPPLGTGAGNIDAQDSAGVMIPVMLDHCSASENPKEILIVTATPYEKEVFTKAVEARPPGSLPLVN